jgi:putative flavoprotein involved in K+ transport
VKEAAMSKQHYMEERSGHPAAGSERFETVIETVIIGGGQAGLSVGYHLARRGLPFVILDANERIGDSWRKRWDSLRLFTPARYDGLAGMPFSAPAHAFPTKDEMADYLEAYAARFDLPVRTGVSVDGLDARVEGRLLQAGDDGWADAVLIWHGLAAKVPALVV